MSGHERHLRAGELLADRARLLRIAGVVADLQLELLAHHAAGGVDVGDRRFGAVLELGAERGVLAGHRSGDADGDVLGRRRAGQRQARAQRHACKPHLLHAVLLKLRTADLMVAPAAIDLDRRHFVRFLPRGHRVIGRFLTGISSPGAAVAPGQRAGPLIEPVVLRRHLGGPRHPPGQRADDDEIERVGSVGRGRQQRPSNSAKCTNRTAAPSIAM